MGTAEFDAVTDFQEVEFHDATRSVAPADTRSVIDFSQLELEPVEYYFDSTDLDRETGWHDASLRARFMEVIASMDTLRGEKKSKRLLARATDLIHKDRLAQLQYRARMCGLRLEFLGSGPIGAPKVVHTIGGRTIRARRINSFETRAVSASVANVLRQWGAASFDCYYLGITGSDDPHQVLIGAIESGNSTFGEWFIIERPFAQVSPFGASNRSA